ncbi:MAG: TatD family hydrolase [Ferrimonas sp.]
MIDSHCHLNLPPLHTNLEGVLAAAEAVGVHHFFVPAIQRACWPQLRILNQWPQLSVAIGLHPCFAHNVEADLAAMTTQLSQPHPFVAIGECGLDGVAGQLPMPEQQALCAAQLQLAIEHHLPVLLHVRQAHNELLQLLKRHPLPAGGIVHGFSGSIELARQYVRHGLLLGIGGVCTYPRARKTQITVSQLPLSALVFETDSPDMPPLGFQGQPNQPKRLPAIIKHVAQLRQQSMGSLVAAQRQNLRALFPHLVAE